MTCLLTGDQLKKKPPQTSLSCVLLWDIRQATSFPAVLSSLSPSSSLKNQVLQFAIEIMSCLRKFQLPKTPSYPGLESVTLFFFKLQALQPLVQLLSILFLTCLTRGRSRNQHCFHIHPLSSYLRAVMFLSPSDNPEPEPEPAEQGHGSALQGPDSSSKSPQTSVAFNQSCGHSVWGKQPEWLRQSAPRPCSGHQVLRKSVGCLIWPRSPKPWRFSKTGAGDVHFTLRARQGKAGWNTTSSHKALITPKISHLKDISFSITFFGQMVKLGGMWEKGSPHVCFVWSQKHSAEVSEHALG